MMKIRNAYKIVFGINSSDLCLYFNIAIKFNQISCEAVVWKMVSGYSNNKF